jgi:energy-coupling factor transporter ATP-binding protein EcfA2
MNNLRIQNFGQIKDANLTLGDLTVLVGPQATGKSITLQLLKLLLDTDLIKSEMRIHGLDWDNAPSHFFDAYLGEGMSSAWNLKSILSRNGVPVDIKEFSAKKNSPRKESLFYIPAQRVLTFSQLAGWPRSFNDYIAGDPFVVRSFSEKIRVLMDAQSSDGKIFPSDNFTAFNDSLSHDIFADFALKISKVKMQKRLVLQQNGNNELPYMVWSAGQREFVPLLLGIHRLLNKNDDNIKWVVIEEPEAGLHPKAIEATLLLIFELLRLEYRVCLSTHSAQILDILWALNHLQENNTPPESLLDIFNVPHSEAMQTLAQTVLKKTRKVYYFDRKSGITRDISNLDPEAEEEGNAGWGGLSEFSGRIGNAVANAVVNPR